ncbi:hypothetical protein I7I50_00601 [Histoplasma capsulatum G186AR]|uniref:Uncharacterized protein n=1 Tax=Ajellomyces capsulatus TaxID=5037 RepID=A0A8H7YGC8_AJECA|nr:hypothetical protein I7I52_07869 [Histoplasma capsulatum]QSS72679.1 hypothetical protein I7I50_00601 [Histoplasma capsulatum G186AR]
MRTRLLSLRHRRGITNRMRPCTGCPLTVVFMHTWIKACSPKRFSTRNSKEMKITLFTMANLHHQ